MEIHERPTRRFSWRWFWKIRPIDVQLALLMTASILVVWLILLWKDRTSLILIHDHAYQYLYVAKNGYQETRRRKMLEEAKVDPNTFWQAYPAVPLLLRLLSFLFFGKWTVAAIAYILSTSILSIILFRRFLELWQVVENPNVTAHLFLLFPLRYFAVRPVIHSESLLFCFVFMALIGVKLRSFHLMFWFALLAALTNTEGVFVGFGIAAVCALRDRMCDALKFLFVPLACLFLTWKLQSMAAGSLTAFLDVHFQGVQFYSFLPFGSAFAQSLTISTLQEFHTIYAYQFTGIIGLCFLFFKSLTLFVFSIIMMIYVLVLGCADISRNAFCSEVLTVLIGLDVLISNERFRKILPVIKGLYFLAGLRFATNTLLSSQYRASLYLYVIGM